MRVVNPPPLRSPLISKEGEINPAWAIWLSTLANPLSWTAVSSFTGSWASAGSPYHDVGYSQDVYGIVRLRGRLTTGTGDAFTLPPNFRPGATQVFSVSGGTVTITTAGVVTPSAAPVDLDSISFVAEA